MIEKEGLIYKSWGKRTLLLRKIDHEREVKKMPANFMGTGLALVGITRKYETPSAMIDRINGMQTQIQREVNAAFTLYNQTRNDGYKKGKKC